MQKSFITRGESVAMIRNNAALAVKSLPLDEPHEIIIRPYKKTRSQEQNAMFHALMQDLSQKYSEAYGESVAPDVWKEFLKRKFLGQEIIPMRNGESFTYTRHTSSLKTGEMAEFIDSCLNWCAEELKLNIGENGNA